jgi:hypothetical protein
MKDIHYVTLEGTQICSSSQPRIKLTRNRHAGGVTLSQYNWEMAETLDSWLLPELEAEGYSLEAVTDRL